MNKKQILKSIIFIVIFAGLYYVTNNIFISKWTDSNKETYTTQEFYKLPKNSVEVLGLGSSQVVQGICPMEMYVNNGVSAYNIAMGSEPILVSYFWLQEALRTQDIKVVYFDTSMLFEPTVEANYRKGLDTMKMSLVKLKAIKRHCIDAKTDKTDGVDSYLIPFMKYHSRWDSLEEKDYYTNYDDPDLFRGYTFSNTVKRMNPEEIVIGDNKVDEDFEVMEVELDYFNQLINLCKEKNIELVLVKTPKANWTLGKHNYVQQIADEENIEFLDFNMPDYSKAIGFDAETDMTDKEHLNFAGAKKLSGYLGEYFAKNFELTDFRDSSKASKTEMDEYIEKSEVTSIQVEYRFSEYIKLLGNKDYDVILSLTSDNTRTWSDKQKEIFRGYGIDFEAGMNYVCYYSGGELVEVKKSEEDIKYEGKLSDGTSVSAFSDINTEYKKPKIQIGDVEYAFPCRGLNMFTYDTKTSKVIESISFNMDERDGDLRKRTGR